MLTKDPPCTPAEACLPEHRQALGADPLPAKTARSACVPWLQGVSGRPDLSGGERKAGCLCTEGMEA